MISTVASCFDVLLIDIDLNDAVLFSSPFSLSVVLLLTWWPD